MKIIYHSREKAKQLIVTSSIASSGTSGRPELSVHDSSVVFPLRCLRRKLRNFSTFREATHESANRIAFHALATAQELANQIAIMPKSLYLKVVCLTFFLLRFFLKLPRNRHCTI